MTAFPGNPPRSWSELTAAQRAWFEARAPWLFDGREPLRNPVEQLAAYRRGEQVLARYRPTDPLRAAWPPSLSGCLTK